ncbi:MAG: 2-amino-4-hydroxy-6-hydroxymethyldihydropteridine diphosphokinase [Fibrobacter sp.]|nr:2-amino-4-hydroxy-6-hydroxymethyldihydropteridine diphosphokinase [Fibrobacter sp.]
MEFLERVFVALGSNLEPRSERLAAAREMLRRVAVGGWKESPVYETPPVGPSGQGRYYNQVVSFWYTQGAVRLLNYLKGAECFLGRKPRGHWEAREIDLDLLFYGNTIVNGRPTLPHPEIYKRQFVLVPFCDIAPEWVDPLTGSTMQELLSGLREKEGDPDFVKIEEQK